MLNSPVTNNYFEPMGKIPRLHREIIVTEKIDGTNAQILVWDFDQLGYPPPAECVVAEFNHRYLMAGSRNRWLSVGQDNYGFASWVRAHAEELIQLGPGRHFGEWWGLGINRAYGLTERRFSLFNVSRWDEATFNALQEEAAARKNPAARKKFSRPACCGVVPVLYRGPFAMQFIDSQIIDLRVNGSKAVPGFKRPEGVVVYHVAANQLFKITLENDHSPKSICI